MLVGIDIGGTFTDIVLLDKGGILAFLKVPSTPGRLEEGVIRGLELLQERLGLRLEEVERIVHGSTVATNALLEGKWAPTALITTAGFRDVLEIGRQNRPRIYDLFVERPKPIVPRDLRFEVPERLDYQGRVIRPLDEGAVVKIAKGLVERGVRSVAISFLFSYANPEHERRVAEILREELQGQGEIPITLSSEVLPEFREYERTMTTVINAALRPVIGDYLERLEEGAGGLGFRKGWQIMQSNAGIIGSLGAQAQPVKLVLSGPAAGVVGAKAIGEQAGFTNLITLDMGGTSCDVSLIKGGEITITTEGEVGGYPIKVPMVAIHTIGAGGGSIAWIDKGGALRVGPESAGADPGPVCYGRGGQEPTVTDAHLVLGRLDPKSPLGGLEELDLEGAKRAISERIAKPLGLSLEEAAQGILAVADANMERAIRVISVERGHDPREFVLLSFGGAGPLHGAGLAAALGIPKVLIPGVAGVLSALGLLETDLAHDYVQSIVREMEELDPEELNAIYEALREKGREELLQEGVKGEEIRYQPSVDLRYLGQSYELNLSLSDHRLTREGLKGLVARFHKQHQRVYGHAAPGEPVELVNLRLRAIGLMERLPLRLDHKEDLEEAQRPPRAVHFPKAGWIKARVFARESLPTGLVLSGPAILEGRESTALLPPGMRASVDPFGNLIIDVSGGG
ncbi:MAG: hydantoinase/oxoprolinase family protein [Candidatus Bipolaricaulia bacterium]